VTIPDDLLQTLGDKTQELDKSVSDLFTEAIARHVEVGKTAPDSLRSSSRRLQKSSQLVVEIPDALFRDADKLAKRLDKSRDALYSEALARYLSHTPAALSMINDGHDLPPGAWRPK
jgi:metal-responsive CopG/Arc/MetJ family transcriptional regulator